jgi:hypothetical protein
VKKALNYGMNGCSAFRQHAATILPLHRLRTGAAGAIRHYVCKELRLQRTTSAKNYVCKKRAEEV